MIPIISKNPLVEKIVGGGAGEEIIRLLLLKQLPFTDEEYLESLVFLLDKEELADKASPLLAALSESVKANYVTRIEANHRVAHFILMESLAFGSMNIVSSIIRNQALPHEFLVTIAEKGNLTMLEMLLENQVKLIAYPQIMDSMENNPEVDNFLKGKITQMRDFYLKEEKCAEIPKEAVLEDLKEIIPGEEDETEAAEEEGPEEAEESLDDLIEKKALTTLQRINQMSVSERIKLALTGTKTERMILVKDPNKLVSLAVVESPKISEDEVILIVQNKSIGSDLIGNISKKRSWTKNYRIVLELVHNPKVPVKDALGFIKKLHIRDLKSIARDKNVSPVVRKLAFNYQMEKEKVRK